MATRRSTLTEAMTAGPVLLDGGLASELEAAGQDLTGALWSGRVLQQDPAAVRSAHERFFGAGAQVATTASYQISYEGLAALGFDRAETDRLLRLSVTLASQARAAVPEPQDRWVAASVGPYGAALADGSEYRGNYGRSVSELRAWHGPRLAVLAESGADVLALETLPCLAEVEALLAEVDGTGMPCWLSLTCGSPSTTRAGEPVAEAFTMARDVAEVIAVGINCLPPQDSGPLLAAATRLSGKPGVVYPNSGQQWDARTRQWRGDRAGLVGQLDGWLADGARLVGGCCQVLSPQIAVLRDEVAARSADSPRSQPIQRKV